MLRRSTLSLLIALAFVAPTAVLAQEAALSEVFIEGARDTRPSLPDRSPYPIDKVTREGVVVFGGPAQSSQYRLLHALPSANAESADGYGLSITRNLNIRGKGDFHVTRNVEGIPLTGIVGGNELFNLEDAQAFEVYRGVVPANTGFGVSGSTGGINLVLRRPESTFGFNISQALGSESFRRTYIRLDTGRLNDSGTAVFLSASDAGADKYKGAGDAVRRNFTLGVSQPLPGGGLFELFAVSNTAAAYDYRALTYAQTLDKNNYRSYDFDTQLNAAQRQQYFDFNKQVFDDTAFIANLVLPVGAGKLTFRPYFSDDDGARLFASGPRVRRWDIVHEQKGFLLQYDIPLSERVDLSAGYWWMNFESPPPPVFQKDYTPTASGDLTFSNFAVLSRQGQHGFRSPFAQLTARDGSTTYAGGVRLVEQRVPYFSYYLTTGLPDLSYEDALARNPALDTLQQVAERTFRRVLPNFSVRQELNPEFALTAAYGRRMGRPDWGPLATAYTSNRAAFVARNISLQSRFDNLKPELSDNVDLGLRYDGDRLSLVTNLYYSRTKDKEVNLLDPLVNVSYPTSFARTTGKGIEFEGSYRFNAGLVSSLALSYNSLTFDDDVQARPGAVTAVSGKQVPNTAKLLGKFALDWRSQSWFVSPSARYIGKRYGDNLNKEKVPGYFVADLSMGYVWRNPGFAREAGVTLSVLNLFDKQYIGLIAPNDLDPAASSNYYAGAPRAAALVFNARF